MDGLMDQLFVQFQVQGVNQVGIDLYDIFGVNFLVFFWSGVSICRLILSVYCMLLALKQGSELRINICMYFLNFFLYFVCSEWESEKQYVVVWRVSELVSE
eukprot:TRINITY_DN10199_c1_g2_i4.p4 TRINITY_DN10199_c1_g2~~TRINITY_DN10199_c1_g2_i4.p4  ORF type:complete len:101 (-),score=12.63 TRINITY_DN10199_c1_g2_i4:93-395(-)